MNEDYRVDAGSSVGRRGPMLRESEIAHLVTHGSNVLESTTELILRLDLDGKLLSSNRTLSVISLLSEFESPEKSEEVSEAFRQARDSGKSHEFEICSHVPDSEPARYLCRIESVLSDGDLVSFTVTATDVTHIRKIEEDLRRCETELDHVSRLNTMGEMTAGIAHELNQPLYAIVNYAETCRECLKNRQEDHIRMAVECAEKISGLASRAGEIVRCLSRFVEKRDSQTSIVEVDDLIEESLELVASELLHGGTRVTLKLSSPAARVQVDCVLIQQVLINILKNAGEALSENTSSDRHVTLSTTSRDNVVEITVRDNGPDMANESIAKMFEAFYTTKPKGMGVGLAISRRIVEANGGRMWASRGEERGLAVSFTLPVSE